ncbi:MAG TPA: rRNA maturation RNase YbeY [Blastocatellia bacterium]|nr:rRNA maturation RNase YbeY [Blastocatellia bacterium]
MAIEVVNRQRLARIDARRVASLVDATLGAIGRAEANLTVAFVRDRVIRDLNRKFRGNDRVTDVLSFPAEDERGHASEVSIFGSGVSAFLGDIVVSTDTALKQADNAGHSFEREVDELVIHGVLHLCGYDHETDRGQMNRLELRLRRKLLGE